MKSEERHQLLTNDLGVVTERTVGFFEQHLMTIISSACAALLVAALGFWWTRSTETDVEAGWTLLDSAQNLEEFGNVVDKFKDKPAGQWAQLIVSETNLKTALPLMFTNRDIALTDIKSAREGFEKLLQEKTASPHIRERALWGLALCLETTSDGTTTKAIEAYERLLAEYPDTIFKVVAEDRVSTLKKDGAKDFYAWFSKESPKPPEARPRDFKNEEPGGKDEPIDFGSGASKPSDKTETDKTEKPEGEKPADEAKPQSSGEGDKPAEEKNSVELPEPTKPGEEPPKNE